MNIYNIYNLDCEGRNIRGLAGRVMSKSKDKAIPKFLKDRGYPSHLSGYYRAQDISLDVLKRDVVAMQSTLKESMDIVKQFKFLTN